MIFNLSILFNMCSNAITTIVIAYVISIYCEATKKEKIRFILLVTIITTILSYIINYLVPSLSTYGFIIQMVTVILCSFLTIKNNYKQVFIFNIISFLGVAFIEIIVSSIWTKFVATDINKYTVFAKENMLTTLFMIVLWLFIALIIYTIIYYIINYFKKKNISKYLPLAILFPLTQMICLLYTYNIVINLVDIKGYIISLAIISVFSVVADIALFSILKYLYNKDNLEKNNILMQKQLQLERNYYNKLVSDIEATNKIRHDINNQLQSIYVLLEKGNEKDVREMKKEIKNKLALTEKVFCNNDIVEAVMLEKQKLCKNNGINLKTDINLSEKNNISKLDLCSIFSNIMDNAIDASSKAKDPYITLKVFKSKGYIVINEKNNKINIESQKTKSNSLIKKHGVGLTILKDIADNYNGRLDIINEKDTFEITLLIKHN